MIYFKMIYEIGINPKEKSTAKTCKLILYNIYYGNNILIFKCN